MTKTSFTGSRHARGDPARREPDAVKITLGPKGRNVLLDRKFGSPLMTKDGGTVAKEIELKEGIKDNTTIIEGSASWPTSSSREAAARADRRDDLRLRQ